MIDEGKKTGSKDAESYRFPNSANPDEVQFLDADQIAAAAAAAGMQSMKKPDRPTIVVNIRDREPIENVGRDAHVQQMSVIKPKVEMQKPVDVTDKRKQAIKEGLATDSAESRSKIAEFLLFNLRGVRTNKGLSTNDFKSIQELEESLKSLPVLKGEEDYTVMSAFDEKGKPKFDSVRGSKIVAIPLSGLKVAGRAAEINLDIRYIPGAFSEGSFEVVGVKMLSAGEPGILKKIGSFFGKK
jgi:hypothetical protein